METELETPNTTFSSVETRTSMLQVSHALALAGFLCFAAFGSWLVLAMCSAGWIPIDYENSSFWLGVVYVEPAFHLMWAGFLLGFGIVFLGSSRYLKTVRNRIPK